MAETFFLKCMGYPELRRPDGRPVRVKVRKHLGVLLYLAVEGRHQCSRDVLVDLLWGSAPPHDGRHSLSTALSFLRAILGKGAIEGTSTSVRFDRAAVTLDLDLLRNGLNGNGSGGILADDSFLADFSIADSPGFMHWRDGHQARLLPVIQGALRQRIDEARRTSDVQALILYGDRLLVLDPLSEEGTRARVEAHALSGNRLAALRMFEEWKSALQAELGARPSEVMEALALRLRKNAVERPASPMATLKNEKWVDRAFIGRAAEFQVLFEAWEAMTQAHTRHVMIEGESGIGKSTLAQRFSTAIQLEGAACARVQCFELEQRIPFGMIGTLVTSLLDRPGVAGTDPAALAELGRLVPRVRERFTQLPPPRGAEGEAARVLFAEGFFAMLESLVEEQPVALIVDDYPRSDEASLSVLHMLLRRPGLHRVMVVLTARPAEPGEPAQAQRIRRGVASLGLQQLKLEPLAEADSNALLDALVSPSGRWLKPPERRAILRAGAGNPLAIELLAQDWIAHGDAAVVLSLPAMQADVPATAFDVSAFDRAVDRLVPSLSRRGRAALWIATILGPRLNDLSFFALVDLEDHRLIAALAELTACRILREAGGRLEFSNELMRARLYLQVPSGIRIELHKRVAERLIEADARGQKISGLEIAWHCMRARKPALATPYLMQGARRAIATGASDEAARALSTALKHLKGRDRDEGIILLAETLQEMADWTGSLEVLGEIERRRKIDTELGEIRDCMLLESKRRLGYYSRSEMVAIVLNALASLPRLKSHEAGARCLLFAAKAGSALRDDVIWNAMRSVLTETTFSPNNARLEGMTNLARALTSYYLGLHEEALSILNEATARFREEKIADTVAALLHTGIGAVCCATGRYEAAVQDTERALEIAKRLDNDDLVLNSAANLALCHLRLGEYAMAQEVSAKAATRWLNRGERPGFDAMRAILHGGLGAAFANNREQAEQAAGRATALLINLENSWEKQFAVFMLADLLWLLGRHREALRMAKQGLRLGSGPATKQMIGLFARWSAMIAARSRECRSALDSLYSFEAESNRIDALDKLELNCAILLLKNTLGEQSESYFEVIRVSLATFPIPVSYQLIRLGILSSSSVAKPLPEASLRSKNRTGLRTRHTTNRP